MPDILKEMIKMLPENKIYDSVFEGANIVFYTKDKKFFLDNEGIVKKIVDEFKKRVEIRPDPSITMPQEKAEREIRKIFPEDAGVTDIIFDPMRSRVIIHAEKPGLAIGKQGTLLRDIREKTMWVPIIRRTPPIRSKIVDDIRAVLYKNSEYRRKFLDKVGHRIYDGWMRGKKQEWIRITFLGGARQVGRSCILLQTPESRILLDCGIDVAAPPESAYPHLEAPEFNIEQLDAVVVSHAHLDHVGFIPYLFKYGYRGPVYCTAPTRDMMSLLQLDLIKIAMNEGNDPLYTSVEVEEMVKHTICLDWEEVTDITPDVRLTLYNSGHTLGSSICHLHIGNGLHNLVYTGDQKYLRTNVFESAIDSFPRCETMILEATYGGKDAVMKSRKEADELLKTKVVEVIKRGGKILMPVLGSGRGEQVMLLIEELVRKKEIPELPVYIHGMVWDIAAIHTAYPEFLNPIVRKQIFHKDQNPFLSPLFKRVGSAKEKKQILEEEGSCLILATSGMLTGGPSVDYFKELANDPRNVLIFSCYQSEASLGRRLLNGEKQIIFRSGTKQEVVDVKMEVVRMEFGDHSDRNELMNYVNNCDPRPKKIIINHGEVGRCLDLASSIHKQFHIETIAPKVLESIRLK
ncbi:MAG: beta-CASP ribonuclease aCPSF1 [Candidatus Woesearchaeota archaeon]